MNLIITLWGLLFTKCFLLEFLVRHYDAPVNTLTYVWTLSVLMATVATAVYGSLQSEERSELFKQRAFLITVLTGLVVAILVLSGLTASAGSGAPFLALAALVLALKHFCLKIRSLGGSALGIAAGWFVASIALLYIGSPAAFLVFSIAIFCLTVIPGISNFLARRKAGRALAQ